jgi:hypothetical protein
LASKKTARRETASSRLLHIVIMTAALVLLFPSLPFGARLPMGPLAWRFVPDSPAIAWTGLALTVAGCAFAIWARLLLGGNWSGSVTVKQDHQLIRGDRTPSSAIRSTPDSCWGCSARRWRWANGAASPGWRWHSSDGAQEVPQGGSLHGAQFGAEYTGYQREVKALIPFVL